MLSVFFADRADPGADAEPHYRERRGREALAESLESDREAMERLDDDHYDGIIDRATWMRQRSRLVERIRSRQHDYQQRLARIPVVDVNLDVSTVASEWEGPALRRGSMKRRGWCWIRC